MDEAERLQYETQSKDLRLELKTWELDFANKHNGSKPGREDIKADPSIASMYKNYNRLRDIISGKMPPPPPPPPPKDDDDEGDDDDDKNRKRKPHNPPALTPSSKRFRPAGTPSRTTRATTAAVTPSLSRQLFTPTVPTSIGPTPQRDGRVLGLFDFLPFRDAEIESPSRPGPGGVGVRRRPARGGGAPARGPGTPGRGRYTIDTGVGLAVDLARTPTPSRASGRPQQQQQQQQQRRRGRSPGREDVLLATPSRRGRAGAAGTPGSAHSSVSRLQFQTPAFLRRIPMPSISGGGGLVSPRPIRLPGKPVVRGLSSILADLRRAEEEHLDDELEALREVEDGGASAGPVAGNPGRARPASAQAGEAQIVGSILAEDSQKQNMHLLGGFDDEAMYDSQDGGDEGVDRDGKPLKVYKKKGQKRTTRKANMRPVRTRRPPAGSMPGEGLAAGEKGGEVVPETRHGASSTSHPDQQQQQQQQLEENDDDDDDDPAMLSGSEFAGSAYDDDEDELARDEPQRPGGAAGRPSRKKQTAPARCDDDRPEGKVKKAARKVNELAHANFKRLKLRNSGAKGGPGFNSRFRRRR